MSEHFLLDVIEPFLLDPESEDPRLREVCISGVDFLEYLEKAASRSDLTEVLYSYLYSIWPLISPVYRDYTRIEVDVGWLPAFRDDIGNCLWWNFHEISCYPRFSLGDIRGRDIPAVGDILQREIKRMIDSEIEIRDHIESEPKDIYRRFLLEKSTLFVMMNDDPQQRKVGFALFKDIALAALTEDEHGRYCPDW